MAVGASGRIVLELDPRLKHELYAALRAEEMTLKDWFIGHAQSFIARSGQLQLRFDAEPNEHEASNETV
ncbi:MAG TPA: hypothetical protein VED01_21615 [Burkholderiales bacterium]|nr:hypothetical protein [Burkholderiales bacterium]